MYLLFLFLDQLLLSWASPPHRLSLSLSLILSLNCLFPTLISVCVSLSVYHLSLSLIRSLLTSFVLVSLYLSLYIYVCINITRTVIIPFISQYEKRRSNFNISLSSFPSCSLLPLLYTISCWCSLASLPTFSLSFFSSVFLFLFLLSLSDPLPLNEFVFPASLPLSPRFLC